MSTGQAPVSCVPSVCVTLTVDPASSGRCSTTRPALLVQLSWVDVASKMTVRRSGSTSTRSRPSKAMSSSWKVSVAVRPSGECSTAPTRTGTVFQSRSRITGRIARSRVTPAKEMSATSSPRTSADHWSCRTGVPGAPPRARISACSSSPGCSEMLCGIADLRGDSVDAGAGGDIQVGPVGSAKTKVADQLGNRDCAEFLTVGGEDVHAVRSRRPDVPVNVDTDPVGEPVVDDGKDAAVLAASSVDHVVGADVVIADTGSTANR